MSQAVPAWQPEAAATPRPPALLSVTPRAARPLSALSISLLTAATVASVSLGYISWRVGGLPTYDPNAAMQAHNAAVTQVALSDSATAPHKLAVLEGTPASIISAAPAPVINAAYNNDQTPQAIPLAAQTDDGAVANALHPETAQPDVITVGDEVATAEPPQAQSDDAPPPVPQGADAVLMPPSS